MSAPTEKLLAQKLREFRIGNGYEEGNPELDVAKFNQSKLFQVVDPVQPTAQTWLTLKARELASGEVEFVDQKEAERRAQICSTCQMNQPNRSPCSSCRNTQERMVNLLTNGKQVSSLPLHQCAVYGYSLKLATLLGSQNLERTEAANAKAPQVCWVKDLTDDTQAV